MGDIYAKRLRGMSPTLPAEIYNQIVEQAQGADFNRARPQQKNDPKQTCIINIRNDSGEDVGRFDILALDEPLIPPEHDDEDTEDLGFKEDVSFSGVTPDEDYTGNFAVMLEPVAVDQIGRGIVMGVVPVRLLVNPDSLLDYADVEEDETGYLINKSHGSAQVLWMEDTEDEERWAVVRIGNPVAAQGQYVQVVDRTVYALNTYKGRREVYDSTTGVKTLEPEDPEYVWIRFANTVVPEVGTSYVGFEVNAIDDQQLFRVLGGGEKVKGILSGNLLPGLSATMRVWDWNGTIELDTGLDITVWDWLLADGDSISSGTNVTAFERANRWYIDEATCSNNLSAQVEDILEDLGGLTGTYP